jgi:hypothetical protein
MVTGKYDANFNEGRVYAIAIASGRPISELDSQVRDESDIDELERHLGPRLQRLDKLAWGYGMTIQEYALSVLGAADEGPTLEDLEHGR